MKCINCETEFATGKFCPKCGAKQEMAEGVTENKSDECVNNECEEDTNTIVNEVIKSLNVCRNCQQSLREGAQFCPKCGEVVANEPTVQQVVTEEVTTKSGISPSGFKKIFCIVAAVGVVLSLVAVLGTSKSTNRWNIYGVDNDLYIEYKKGEYTKILDDPYDVKTDLEGNHLYVLNDEEELYYDLGNGKLERIAKDVDTFAISDNGEAVIYIEDVNYNTGEATIGYKIVGKEAVEITDACNAMVQISPNGQYIVYGVYDSDYTKIEIYRSEKGEKAELLIDEIHEIVEVSNKGDVLAVNEDSELILIQKDGSHEVVVKDYYSSYAEADFSKIYAANTDGEVGVYAKGEWIELEDKMGRGEFSECSLPNGKSYVRFKNSEESLLFLKNNETIKIDTESFLGFIGKGESFYYLEDDELYINTIKGNKISYEEEISDEVVEVYRVPNKEILYYVDGAGDLYKYTYKKESEKVAKDVMSVVINESGSVYYIDDKDNLYVLDKKGESTKIEKEIAYLSAGVSDEVFAINDDEDLYRIEGKEAERIKKDVDGAMVIGKEWYINWNNSQYYRSIYAGY